MCSPRNLLLGITLSCSLAAHAEIPARAAAVPAVSESRDAIERGVAQLRQDPKLGHTKIERHLRLDDFKSNAEEPKPTSGPDWLLKLLDFLTGAGRLLVWALGAVIAGCLAIWIWRLVITRQATRRLAVPRVASHVHDLDIRPASLPTDIGAAALAQLQAGNPRAALSLLYRGSLSRAVHRFAVHIGESFTESEALRAVSARLDTRKSDYFAALVRVWQRTVYGALEPPHAEVAALCDGFAGTFDAGAA